MAQTLTQYPVVVEEWITSGPKIGPTGRFQKVALVEVRDYGNNVVAGPIPASNYFRHCRKTHVATKLVAVRVEGEPSENITGEYLCDYYDPTWDRNAAADMGAELP